MYDERGEASSAAGVDVVQESKTNLAESQVLDEGRCGWRRESETATGSDRQELE